MAVERQAGLPSSINITESGHTIRSICAMTVDKRIELRMLGYAGGNSNRGDAQSKQPEDKRSKWMERGAI